MRGTGFIFIFAILATGITPFILDTQGNNHAYDKIGEDCATELGLDIAEIRSVDPTDINAWTDLFKYPNFKCFSKCIGYKAGMINDNGDMDAKIMAKMFELTVEQAKILEVCINKINDADVCTKVNMVLGCAYKDGKP